MKLKKIFSAVCILALVAVLAAGCSGSGSGGGGDESSGSDVIKIGLNYELTGDVATYGQQSVEGIEMAVDEINAAGGVLGKQIELIKMDNKSDAAEALSIATNLMTRQGVVAVLGPATSGRFKNTIPAATEYQIPVLSGSATAEDVTADENGVKEFAFRICFRDSFQGTAMANFAMKNLSASKAVVIMDNTSDYAKGLAENFEATFTDNGGEIVAEEGYVTNDKDFYAILTSIKAKNFDVIFIPGYYQEAGLIIKQAREMVIDVPILGADGFDSPALVELAGADALNNVYFSNHYSSLDKDPLVLQFIEDFKARYGTEPSAFNALGYDMGKFVADAIERAGSDDPIAIKDAMASTTNFVGVTGTFSIDEEHNAIKSAVIIGLENGEQATSVKAGL